MLKYLIQVIQNSLTTAVLLAMLFSLAGYAPKSKRGVRIGAGLGVLTGLLLAVLKHTTVLINREYFNIGILSAAVLCEIAFLLLVWVRGKQKPGNVREGLTAFFYAAVAALLLFYMLPDLFLYPTEFVDTDGTIFSTAVLFKCIGYVLGLVVVVLLAVALYQAVNRVSRRLVKPLLSMVLVINLVSQVATILQPLLARRIIPMQKWLFSLLKVLINYNAWFLYLTMLVTLAVPLVLFWKARHSKDTWQNPAQHRKIRATARTQRRWSTVILACYLLSLVSVTALKTYSEKEVVLSPAEPMEIVGTEILIPLETVNDGHLHRFAYDASDGTAMRFIVIKKNEVSYGVGLDACDICGPTGYYERKDEVVCKLCDVVMNKSTIGFKGGCNPVPLAYSVRDGKMVILLDDLEAEKRRFA